MTGRLERARAGLVARLFARHPAAVRRAAEPGEPAAMAGYRAPAIHRCPLCGRDFDEAEAAECTVCPLARRCGLVLCPDCGYEFPAR